MFGLFARAPVAPRSYADCTGCSLCFLVCPMWRASHDPRLTPEGIAKGLQAGAVAADLVAALDACSLCGACDPVCPEGIDLPGLVMDLRRRLPRTAVQDELRAGLQQVAANAPTPAEASRTAPLLLPGADLRGHPAILARVQSVLGLTVVDDDGADIALALEAGVEIPPARLQPFLESLRGHSIVAEDGLLLRQLRRWLPGSSRMGLGAALSSRASVRGKLGAGDLYVIEPRAYHADYERMVGYYDRLQRETGCSFNLDLQRIAIPATARVAVAGDDAVQAKWILQGSKTTRVVVESLADRIAFERVCDLPVLHIVDLVENFA